MLTEYGDELEYRDDLQVMTTNVYYGVAGGLALVPGTYHAFGNNGTTPYKSSVNSGSNTALNNRLVTNGPVFISAAQLYLDLTTASESPARGGRLHHPHRRAGSGLTIGTGTGGNGDVHLERSGQCGPINCIPLTNLVQEPTGAIGELPSPRPTTIMSASDSIGPDPQRFYLYRCCAVTLRGDLNRAIRG